MNKRSKRLGLTVWAAVMGTFLLVPSLRAAEELSPKLQALREEARALQSKGKFEEAWEKYYQIRKAERKPPQDVIDGYLTCLRRVQQQRRLRDKPALELLADLRPSDALDVYAEVLAKLQAKCFVGKKLDYGALFQYGVQEMRLALEDDAFLREQIRGDKMAALEELRTHLDDLGMNKPRIEKPADAADRLRSVILLAKEAGAKPTAVLVEFVAGACNALDEYTGYLSPTRLAEIEADLNGGNKFVGIGVDLELFANKDGKHLIVTRVYQGSPAYGKLVKDEEIVSIDGLSLVTTPPAMLVAKLQGEPGAAVELEVRSTAGMMRIEKVERQPVAIPSVEIINLAQRVNGIGYIRIYSFQHGTAQELRSALDQLSSPQAPQLKALILDLRGNLGGSFSAAKEVAEQFLSKGTVIVYTQQRMQEKAWVAGHKHPLTDLPLVVLVDGDTASAAEVVAGALKDNKRAKLVGQPTYGKGSIQCLVPLESLKAGLQVTVARFSSLDHVPYDGHGITPNELVESSMMTMRFDQQKERAIDLAQEMIEMSPMLKTR